MAGGARDAEDERMPEGHGLEGLREEGVRLRLRLAVVHRGVLSEARRDLGKVVRVNPRVVRVNPSNSQLRSICHGLLYYGGHAVVTWL